MRELKEIIKRFYFRSRQRFHVKHFKQYEDLSAFSIQEINKSKISKEINVVWTKEH